MPRKMHSNNRQKSKSFNLKTLSAAVVSTLLITHANAAGLGKLTVLSALGQPLHAEIELTAVSKEEAASLAPKLASMEAFRHANVDFNPALYSLQFAVEQRAGRQFIRVTSVQPVNEPFVDMLLELGAANGRLIREYTFLLDPPDLRATQSVQVAAPIVLPPAALARRAPAPAPVAESAPLVVPVRKAPQSAPAVSARSAPRSLSAAGEGIATAEDYKVKSGDYLARIAGRFKPEGVSLDQMLVTLYRTNPDAFMGNNMNRLRAGQILLVPSADTASSISNDEARRIIVAQTADFNHYRNKLAGQVAAAAPQKTAEPGQSASGKISAKVGEQPTAANESKDKLKLSKSGTDVDAAKTSGIAAGTEDKIAKDKAVAEAYARVKELEKNVSDLQKTLEVKNKSLADQQRQADKADAGAKPAEPVVTTAATVPAPAVAEAKPVKAKAPGSAMAKPKARPAPPPSPEPGFLDSLLDNPLLFPAVGALVALLAGFGVYTARRKKQGKQFEDSIISDSSLKANSLFGSTGGQSVDTNNSVFNSNFAPSASQLDTNEVDPVAEADVYIAYGRDAQAEEILKEALRTQPDRNVVRVKLLEIYANRKDPRSFEILASELYALTKGEGEEWAQAAALGAGIDPGNPLYAVGKSPKNTSQEASTMVAPTQPLEEPDLDALLAVTQSNTSLETSGAIEDSSYFGDTMLAAEIKGTEPEDNEPDSSAQEEPAPAKAPSDDLDFDLEGLSFDQMAVANTIPQVMRPEPVAALDEINLDFLNDQLSISESEKSDAAPAISSQVAEVSNGEAVEMHVPTIQLDTVESWDAQAGSAIEAGMAGDQLPSIADDIPAMEEAPLVSFEADNLAHAPASQPEAMDFDLSGITLELDPARTNAGLMQDAYSMHDTDSKDYSSNTEMATKLDLAVAYQEIGDKEGARELLDEVAKGGTSEQVEKAHSLLLKLV